MFRTLSLPIDTDEDFDIVFDDLEEGDDEFELVVSIEENQLENIESLITPIDEHKDSFTLFCEVSKTPEDKVLKILDRYKYCLQSDNKLDLKLENKTVVGKELYFNNLPILYSSSAWDEKQMRNYIEQAAKINTKTILICKYAEAETLNKIRVISEILGF